MLLILRVEDVYFHVVLVPVISLIGYVSLFLSLLFLFFAFVFSLLLPLLYSYFFFCATFTFFVFFLKDIEQRNGRTQTFADLCYFDGRMANQECQEILWTVSPII